MADATGAYVSPNYLDTLLARIDEQTVAEREYWEQFELDYAREKRCVHDRDQINMHSACRGPVVMPPFVRKVH